MLPDRWGLQGPGRANEDAALTMLCKDREAWAGDRAMAGRLGPAEQEAGHGRRDRHSNVCLMGLGFTQ